MNGRQEYKLARTATSGVVYFPEYQLLLGCSLDCFDRLARGEDNLFTQEKDDWCLIHEVLGSETMCREVEQQRPVIDGYHFALNLNLTDTCNLACRYCFARGRSYGRPANVSMQSSVIPDILKLLQRHGGSWSRIEFFGGEPLLCFPLIVEITRALSEEARKNRTTTIFRISTNLTVLTSDIIELFVENKFIVSVSIDGNERTHNRNRPGKNGIQYYDTILRNARALREASGEITLVARVTATGTGDNLWENVEALNSLDLFDYFQVLPVTSSAANTAIILEEFKNFYAKYQRLCDGSTRCRGNLETEFLITLLQTRWFAPAFCSAGRTYFSLGQDKQLYPCHRLLGDSTFSCGTPDDGPTATKLLSWRRLDHRSSKCRSCWMRYLCGGGCKQDHLVKTGSLSEPSADFCALQELTCSECIRIYIDRIGCNRDRTDELARLFVSCGRPSLPSCAGVPRRLATETFAVINDGYSRRLQ